MEEYSIDSYIDPQNVLASTGESSLLAITLQTIKERKKMRKITKIRKSVKAISPIIATLLLIAIAVVAALVVYAWVMGYIGTNTSKSGQALQIQSYTSGVDNNMWSFTCRM